MNRTLGERLVHEGDGATLLGWGFLRSGVSEVGC